MNLIQILGYGLTPDGKVTPILLERLKKGIELLQQSPNSKVIVAGGNAPGQPQENQAQAMRKWLIENDITSDRIIIEDQSISTIEQILFLYEHLQGNNYDEVYIVGTEGGFDKRIELIKDFIFSKENRLNVEGATLPKDITENVKYQFSEGEVARVETLTKMLINFDGDPVEALQELTQKHREGDAEFFEGIGYELSTENKK